MTSCAVLCTSFTIFRGILSGPECEAALGKFWEFFECLGAGIDRETMRSTLRLAVAEFDFSNAYPGDDRGYAMAAARLGEVDIALDMLLKNAETNVFNTKNGHWQGYFPLLTSSNGFLMYAVAMLAGGWDGGGVRGGGRLLRGRLVCVRHRPPQGRGL